MATDGVKELTKKRSSFKGQLTTFVNYYTQLKPPLSSVVFKELQLRIGRIEALYARFDEVQLRIECLVDEVDAQYVSREDFESQYYKALSNAQELLAACSDSPPSDSKSIASNRKLVKLPTIQLPKFNGSYENWLEFRDTFASLIHSNDDIDDINKFHYLRACLESSAAVVIKSIEFSASNYSVAWKVLCERYDNKRLLIQNHVITLFNIEPITKESSCSIKHLIDQLKKNLRALEALGEPVEYWDTLLIYLSTRKLDHRTYREWEEFKSRTDEDTSKKFSEFIIFLRSRADLLETLELSHTNPIKSNPKFKSMVSTQQINKSSSSSVDLPSRSCPKCKGDHNLSRCSQFLALSNEDRLKILPTFKICFNCFRSGHYANRCRKPGCNVCKRRHNSLIHVRDFKPVPNNNNLRNENMRTQVDATPSRLSVSKVDQHDQSLSANVPSTEQVEVLLSTALVKLYDNNNCEHVVRAILDSGSTSSIMTESLFSRLNLRPQQIDKIILGINNVTSHVGKTCRVNMKSLDERFMFDFSCFVLPSITNNVPSRQIDITNLTLPTNVCLADPTFYKPGAVDMLLGADLFWDLLGSQRIVLGNQKPMLIETKLGWIISGPIANSRISLLSSDVRCHFVKASDERSRSDNEFDLTRFWQLEEISSSPSSHYSVEEKKCEEHFLNHMSRLEDGRFCVRIPLKQNPDILGDSFKKATQCLLSMERRLKCNPDLSKLYYDFMSEYELLGHMSECHQLDSNQCCYYIPHHGVRRDQSTTTKLRVVYNASCPTTSGVSSNDIQMVGPTVQDDLLAILLRFRQYKYILAADVEKMYRQIVVHPSDRCLQRILWRHNTDEPIKIFQLNTVTYGTASAPFLATRCLKQLGVECTNHKVAEVIQHDFYVDDLLTGGDNLSEVMDIRREVAAVLASAGMSLRKWQSNEPQLVSGCSKTPLDLNVGSHGTSKLLGLGWCADSDELCFPISSLPPKGNTKRDILSAIGQVFDPLGLLAPAVVRMKILLQRLWLQKLSWDEPLSSDINKRWNEIVRTLPLINNIRIPRIVVCDSHKLLQLHIFTDASELAYGACAYIRTVNDNGEVVVRLLSAKSRVAPIKPLSIPRLELCGALVGTRLYEKLVKSLRVVFNEVIIWTDSMIVLGWLQMHPSKLQPFVRNRVAEVLDKAGSCTWRHIPTELNPADLLSRGMDISSLQNSQLWWNGPDFLNQETLKAPTQPKSVDMLPEIKPDVAFSAVVDSCEKPNLIDMGRFSNHSRLVRTIAYVLRWVDSCRKRPIPSSFLTKEELTKALNLLIKQCHMESFPEYKLLLNNQALPKKSPLLKFNVYLDEHNIMRVGGRLDNSEYHHSKKYPILLQSNHIFTKLLFDYEHRRLMHAGPQLLLASIRETYWPIGGRNLAKACYRRCVKCSRIAGKTVIPVMGHLPHQRVSTSGFPFENVGVDYAGPIMCVSRQGRGCRMVKVYLAIFVCFSTKALHLELVGDLTSNRFLMALYRFISRRGKPLNLYSDNGTSFVGAFNDIAKFLKQNCNSLGEDTANSGISFHFIPAYSPHMGGLWEAGVKSTKYHLQRVLGNCNLTYEELNTTLTQIEAILNSRPLTPLSSDPADCTPLTPGHFIIGRPLTCLPQPDYTDRCSSQLTRFHRIEQLRQHFWTRWSKEYIAELQLRVKWRSCKGSLQLDTLVVVKEDHLPPLKWRLGRIVAVHPGSDGVARVADIRTSTGVIRRSFIKICPLPVSNSG